jgi:hypothetical protein
VAQLGLSLRNVRASHDLAQLGSGVSVRAAHDCVARPGHSARGGAAVRHACSAVATSPAQEGGGGEGVGYALGSDGEAATRRLPVVSDVVDGGVNDVDGEAWTTLGHAWLGSDLRGTTTKR